MFLLIFAEFSNTIFVKERLFEPATYCIRDRDISTESPRHCYRHHLQNNLCLNELSDSQIHSIQ